MAETGIRDLDELLNGGLPIGALTELVGPACSGRSSIALALLARMTQSGKVCAWVDVSNALDPVSASATGVDLSRLLWVRCGVEQQGEPRTEHNFVLPEAYLIPKEPKKGLHGGGFGAHPRTETKGLSQAMPGLLQGEAIVPRCAEPQRRPRPAVETFAPSLQLARPAAPMARPPSRPWSRMEQALRATDLLLQAGGFSALVLDLGSLSAEAVSRVPLATWYRYRAAAEKTQSSILLLTQHPCAKSSAELVLRLQPATAICEDPTVFSGIEPQVEIVRRRFAEIPSNVVPLRKPPQQAHAARWQSRTAWAGRR